MRIVNRIVAVVSPKEPYRQWAIEIAEDESAYDALTAEEHRTAYLLPESDEPEKTLRQHFAAIFEEKLESWHTDPQAWPPNRTWRLFQEWFEVVLVDLVFDVPETPLCRDP